MTENIDIEQKLILNQVKKLFLIPEMEVMTTKMISDYYEIASNTLNKCYRHNKQIIDADGVWMKSYKDFLGLKDTVSENSKGFVTINILNNLTIQIPNRGIKVFSIKAIVHIGILLSDSVVADKLRSMVVKSNNIEMLKLLKDNNPNIHRKQLQLYQILKETFSNIYNINQQVKCGKYYIDYVIKNLAIECDEYGHSDRNKQYEIDRENFIRKQGYKIIRYDPDNKDSNIFVLINNILINM